MIRRLIILLLIVGCEDIGTGTDTGTNPIPCIPDLVCGQAVTCCDTNCDNEIGICDTI